MLKKSITYEDFNGKEVTEEFYFNLTKAELVEMEMDHYKEGGLQEALEKIVAADDGKTIMEEMKKIILRAYGVKSDDGRRFIKNDQLREEFESTEAYSVLFMELVTEADAAVAFVTGIMPKGMKDNGQDELPEVLRKDRPEVPAIGVPEPKPRVLTEAEVQAMDGDELRSGLATGKYVVG